MRGYTTKKEFHTTDTYQVLVLTNKDKSLVKMPRNSACLREFRKNVSQENCQLTKHDIQHILLLSQQHLVPGNMATNSEFPRPANILSRICPLRQLQLSNCQLGRYKRILLLQTCTMEILPQTATLQLKNQSLPLTDTASNRSAYTKGREKLNCMTRQNGIFLVQALTVCLLTSVSTAT